MNRHIAACSVFIASLILIISACGQSSPPAPTQPVETMAAAIEVTATALPTPAATATEPPPLPCMIVFDSDRDGNREVYRMGPDGKDPVNLSNNPADDFDPVWSPDGSRIAFVSNRENDFGGGQYIFVMDAGGGGVRRLSSMHDSKWPDWSPDGSRIAFGENGDIYIIDADGGAEINLTNSPELDREPRFSPDGRQIAWLQGEENSRQIFLMPADGGDARQITNSGNVFDVEWTVDGRLLAHWDNPEHGCFNCIVSADGREVTDAGGKGAIQEFLPFWTQDGKRVELITGPGPKGDEEIFLVSDLFPDIFLNLTNDPGRDINPDAPALCGPISGPTVKPQEKTEIEVTLPTGEFVIGYEVADKPLNDLWKSDLEKACGELSIECVEGENIDSLAEQGVNAILSFSNRWHVLGSGPSIHAAVERGIPVFILNAETNEPGAYNLAGEYTAVQNTLHWMFEQMDGSGEFLFYNFGNNDQHREWIELALKEAPGIRATAMPAEFEGNSLSEAGITELVKGNPNIGAIWTNEKQNDIFWGLQGVQSGRIPAAVCLPRTDILGTWKNLIDGGSEFQCISHIMPGGTAYEGVYAAAYLLSGLKINPDALSGQAGNTFTYDMPVITNESLPGWLGKLDAFRPGQWEVYELPPMSPEEIKTRWFTN